MDVLVEPTVEQCSLCSVQVALYWVPGGWGNYANRDHTRGGQHWCIGSPRSEYIQMDRVIFRISFMLNSIFYMFSMTWIFFYKTDGLQRTATPLPQFNYKFSTTHPPLDEGGLFRYNTNSRNSFSRSVGSTYQQVYGIPAQKWRTAFRQSYIFLLSKF